MCLKEVKRRLCESQITKDPIRDIFHRYNLAIIPGHIIVDNGTVH